MHLILLRIVCESVMIDRLHIALTVLYKVTLNSPCKPLNTPQQDLIQVVSHYNRMYAVMI
jgi:hypothetical protein